MVVSSRRRAHSDEHCSLTAPPPPLLTSPPSEQVYACWAPSKLAYPSEGNSPKRWEGAEEEESSVVHDRPPPILHGFSPFTFHDALLTFLFKEANNNGVPVGPAPCEASKHNVGFLFVLSCLSKQIIEVWIKCGRCASPALDAASQGPQATGWVQQLRHAARGACNYPPASMVALCTHHVPPPIPCCEGWHRRDCVTSWHARRQEGGVEGGGCGGSVSVEAVRSLRR